MRLNELLRELKGIADGDPKFIGSMSPQEMKENIEATVSSIFLTIGFEDCMVDLNKKRFVFDLYMKNEYGNIAIELKLGRITNEDIKRFEVMSEVSSKMVSKLLVLCTDIPENIVLPKDNLSKYTPIQVLTFNQLIEILSSPGGEGPYELRDLLRHSSKKIPSEGKFQWESEVKEYIIETFGNEVFDSISKDQMSISVFSQNKDYLGERPIKIILAGTTHTGKSTIANVLFGDTISKTAHHTDTTGVITKIKLLNGVMIFDTPGVGGMTDKFENVTRAFLGIGQSEFLETVDAIPLVDLTDPNSPKESVLDEPISNVEDYVVLFVFDMVGGLKRADYEFYTLIKSRIPHVVVVGNKEDLLSSEEDGKVIAADLLDRIGLEFIPIAAKPKNKKEPMHMHNLVQRICYVLSENTITMFNDRLVSTYRRKNDELIDEAIERFSAKAATIKPYGTIPGSTLPVHQALFMGLLFRLGIDYEIGGKNTRNMIVETTKELFLHISSTATSHDMDILHEKKKVARWTDKAAQGGAVGVGAGAAIGAIGGPIGMLFGAIFGGLFGASMGASEKVKEMVTVLWSAPVESVTELSGGAEAALATLAFGYALRDILAKTAEMGEPDFDAKVLQQNVSMTYQRFARAILENEREVLDETQNENVARQVIHDIVTRM